MADSSEEDDSQKTEEPSQRKIDKALEEGQIIQSKEINNFFLFVSLFIIVIILFPLFANPIIINLKTYITAIGDLNFIDIDFYQIFQETVKDLLLILALPFLVLIIGIFASYFIQQRTIRISINSIMPSLNKISPMQGLKRIFSMKSVVELLKGIIKLIIIGVTCYIVIKSKITVFRILYDYEFSGILNFMGSILFKLLVTVCIIMFLFSMADYLYQRYEFYKKLRMSKQELKDEYKETEGNPEIKSKQRSRMREISRESLAKSVPQSDVVITNPTHFSICLKYDPNTMAAPIIIAKGQDNLAFSIRKLAKKHDIPIISNPPLARNLFSEVDIGKEIPEKYYKGVAEIISYVFKQKNKKI